MKNGYVYILTNFKKTVLYIGVTSDLRRRMYEHRNGLIPGFIQKYRVKYLIYFETFEEIHDAIYREKTLKGKTRSKKVHLIEFFNPEWRDLSMKLL